MAAQINQVVPVKGIRDAQALASLFCALIERLERTTDPDDALDQAIARIEWGAIPDGTRYPFAPRYTGSIEAALTLLPKHHSYELTQSAVEPPALSRARVWDWRRGPTGIDAGNEWKAEGNRPLAVNICIAAFKVRISHAS